MFTPCDARCNQFCHNLGIACGLECVPGCKCIANYFRDNAGRCIHAEACKTIQLGNWDQVYHQYYVPEVPPTATL